VCCSVTVLHEIYSFFLFVVLRKNENGTVAVCCSVLQCVAVCCSVLQCVALQCVALQCVALQCVALQCAAVCCFQEWK